MIAIQKVRNDTSASKDQIFMNSAGASLMPDTVVSTIKSYPDKEAQMGGYRAAAKVPEASDEFYT
jgi:hypothetical protein